MIYTFKRGKQDIGILKWLDIDIDTLINDHHDYSNEIVQKPWGSEYEVFSNNNISVWILNIDEGQSTSFHCHPNKLTSLIVLSTEWKVICKSALTVHDLYIGDEVLIDAGAFHQTTAFGVPAIIIEIERPNNKNDLVRFKDDYGRV